MPRSWSGSVRDLLVTGTDTGVGKTLVAAALIKAIRARGFRAIGFKPAETGIGEGEEPDSSMLTRAAGENVPLAAPLLRLREPLAPAVAADRAGAALDPDEVELRVQRLRAAGYTIVVEGAGGLMVPLAWDYTALDLAQACNLDAVVVARAGLGTLNHVFMTVMMLQSRAIPIRGVVLNRRTDPPDLAQATNPAALARMLPSIRIIEVPDHRDGDPIGHTTALVDRLL
jgi:dethiobiotin synthetase